MTLGPEKHSHNHGPRGLRTKSSSRSGQVWPAERRVQVSLRSKARIAVKNISTAERKKGENRRTTSSVLIEVLVTCYQMLPNDPRRRLRVSANLLIRNGFIGGPDRDRTDDLFHAMEARSQLRHRPTLRKDSLYSGGAGDIRQRLRELIPYLSVSKDNRVSEHSAAGGAVASQNAARNR